MDSKIVNRELRREIRPALRALGFESSDRTHWRHTPFVIQVINFQSFNSYLAAGIGATTYSFSINLGEFVIGMPAMYGTPQKDGKLYPREYHCQFRSRLLRTIEQKELSRTDTWFVRKDGSNLLECIADAKKQILSKGMAWFEQLSTPEQLLAELDSSILSASGTPESPAANLARAFIFKRLGRHEQAAGCLEAALGNGVYSAAEETIRKAFAA